MDVNEPPLSGRTCPKCQYKRTPDDTAPGWQCPACGVAYNKVGNGQSSRPADKKRSKAGLAIKVVALLAIVAAGGQLGLEIKRSHDAKVARENFDSDTEVINSIISRWDDARALASSTGRISLPGPVQKLQEIARDWQALSFQSKCVSDKVAPAFSEYAKMTINGFLLFMADEEEGALEAMQLREILRAEFLAALRRCNPDTPQP